MRLSLLLAREPFGAILEETLSGYWSDRISTPVTVRWNQVRPGDQVWRGNVYLNFFCVEGVDPACFDVIVREFGHARAAWRRGLQMAYVQAAIRPPTRRWLSQVRFGVSQAIPKAEEMLVIGGNRRIRIIHPRAGRSLVIHKSGYTRTAFDREVTARLGPAAAVAPGFMGVNAEGTAFEEEYFVGTPANRLPQVKEAAVRVEALGLLVERVHRPTLRVEKLADRLRETAEAIARLAPACADGVRRVAEGLATRMGAAPVGVVFSHGDFQDANILVSPSGTRLIDWETSAERSQLYDLATLASGLRLAADRAAAWRSQAERWLAGTGGFPSLLVPAEGAAARAGLLVLWWMEDWLLRLEEGRMLQRGDSPAVGGGEDLQVLQSFVAKSVPVG